ncbi:MAG: alpha/beta fold hydrolase, partial [Lentisphaerota bacterium]
MDISSIKDLYPFKHNYYKLKSCNYHYIDEGRGEPIVMVHGNPSWSFLFRRLISELSRTNRVIVPDHLGCGMSDKPRNFQYRLETHIDNLEEFLLALDLHNINLLVHDWGGP